MRKRAISRYVAAALSASMAAPAAAPAVQVFAKELSEAVIAVHEADKIFLVKSPNCFLILRS